MDAHGSTLERVGDTTWQPVRPVEGTVPPSRSHLTTRAGILPKVSLNRPGAGRGQLDDGAFSWGGAEF